MPLQANPPLPGMGGQIQAPAGPAPTSPVTPPFIPSANPGQNPLMDLLNKATQGASQLPSGANPQVIQGLQGMEKPMPGLGDASDINTLLQESRGVLKKPLDPREMMKQVQEVPQDPLELKRKYIRDYYGLQEGQTAPTKKQAALGIMKQILGAMAGASTDQRINAERLNNPAFMPLNQRAENWAMKAYQEQTARLNSLQTEAKIQTAERQKQAALLQTAALKTRSDMLTEQRNTIHALADQALAEYRSGKIDIEKYSLVLKEVNKAIDISEGKGLPESQFLSQMSPVQAQEYLNNKAKLSLAQGLGKVLGEMAIGHTGTSGVDQFGVAHTSSQKNVVPGAMEKFMQIIGGGQKSNKAGGIFGNVQPFGSPAQVQGGQGGQAPGQPPLGQSQGSQAGPSLNAPSPKPTQPPKPFNPQTGRYDFPDQPPTDPKQTNWSNYGDLEKNAGVKFQGLNGKPEQENIEGLKRAYKTNQDGLSNMISAFKNGTSDQQFGPMSGNPIVRAYYALTGKTAENVAIYDLLNPTQGLLHMAGIKPGGIRVSQGLINKFQNAFGKSYDDPKTLTKIMAANNLILEEAAGTMSGSTRAITPDEMDMAVKKINKWVDDLATNKTVSGPLPSIASVRRDLAAPPSMSQTVLNNMVKKNQEKAAAPPETPVKTPTNYGIKLVERQ